jgi:hypothetical protein
MVPEDATVDPVPSSSSGSRAAASRPAKAAGGGTGGAKRKGGSGGGGRAPKKSRPDYAARGAQLSHQYDLQQEQEEQQMYGFDGGFDGGGQMGGMSGMQYGHDAYDGYGAQGGGGFGEQPPPWAHGASLGGLPPVSGGFGESTLGFGEHMGQLQPNLLLTATDEPRQRELLRGLQLTRDFLRTLQQVPSRPPPLAPAAARRRPPARTSPRAPPWQAPGLMQSTQNYFVRLNMGSRYFLYVAAQIVQINGDELQVCRREPSTLSWTPHP